MAARNRRRIAGPRMVAILMATLGLALLVMAMASGEGEAAPNLYIDSSDIMPTVAEPTRGTTTTVSVTVHNDGDANATGFKVKLRDTTAANDIGVNGPFNLTYGSYLTVRFSWDLTGVTSGNHTLRATADPDGKVAESDEDDNSSTKDVTVNLPPVADGIASPTTGLTHQTISFVASGSTDEDGNISAYLWYFGDGSVASGYNVTHAYTNGAPSPGMTYNVTLICADNDGGVGKHSLVVKILNQAPTASAEGSVIKTVTPTSISGAQSSDVDGKITTYRWTLHNGTVLWGSPAVVSYSDDGLYNVTLTVWDDDGASDSIMITMIVANRPPIVDLDANRTLIAAGDSIHFDGSASTDVDGTITSYTWIFGDQTTSVGSTADHIFPQNGSYNVTLVLVDDDGAVSYDTVRVIVGNSPPIAVARADLGYVMTYVDIEFNASSSIDTDDNIATYAWDFGDGTSGMGAVLVHNYTDDGSYDVTLTVTDSAGAFGTNTVTVVAENRAPNATFVDLEVMTDESALFNGSYCSDVDGYIEAFLWDLGGGLVYFSANASHTWETPGMFVVTLKIRDDDGATNETAFNVTVLNRQPVAYILASPVKTTLSMPVTFNGSDSTDSDGTITNWTWSFGDGARDYGEEVSHVYTAYGTYLATLTVRDDHGGVNTTGLLITVRNQPPTASLEVTPVSALTGEMITFNASNSSDPENQIAEYFWSFGDGSSATGAVVSHAYADDGWYTVRLTVVDQDNTASYDEIVVSIMNKAPKALAEAVPNTVLTLEDVNFRSTGSRDDDGHLLWYRWDFADGYTAYGETAVHAFEDDGVYNVILTVTDDDGAEASIVTEVTVANRAPISIVGSNVTTKTGIPVRLDGRSSYDVDGTISLFSWDLGDGEVATGPVITHAFSTSKTFIVWLEVTDDDGAKSRSNLTVYVQNVKPVAKISGVATVLSGEVVELDGLASYDLDGDIVDYLWDMGDGNSEVGPVVRHTYNDVGMYIVTLTVEDDGELNGGLKDTVQVTVQVLNRRPTAVVVVTVSKLPTGETLELDGTGSTDSDGTVTDHTWIFGDGSVAYGSRVTHVYSDDGIYMVVLTVTDNAGGTDSRSMFIQVENRPPLPAMDADGEVLTLVQLQISAEGSVDPDGVIVGYFWDFGDGNGANGREVNHTYASAGNYTVRLTIMDDDGRTTGTNITVSVINRPPTAVASVIETTRVNSTVKFDATGSSDLDGIMSAWLWEYGDGTTDEGREAYHKYTEVGTYTWNLTVIDDRDEKHTVNGTIVVNPGPYVPPLDDKPNGDDKDDSIIPGPSTLMALAAIGLVSLVAVSSRRRG